MNSCSAMFIASTDLSFCSSNLPLVKSVLLVPSDVPDLLQATSFAFLAAATSLPSEHCANEKQAQVDFFTQNMQKKFSHLYFRT